MSDLDNSGQATKIMLRGVSSGQFEPPSQQGSIYETTSRPETASPTKDSGSINFKQRISNLEIASEIQGKTNDYVYNSLDALASDSANLETRMKAFVDQMKNDFDIKINELKRIYDHRFNRHHDHHQQHHDYHHHYRHHHHHHHHYYCYYYYYYYYKR